MATIRFGEGIYACREGETVLDALLRQGVAMAFSCRSGICRVCVKRCLEGAIPPTAQKGLDPTRIAAREFLPCRCIPVTDMVIADAETGGMTTSKRADAAPKLPDLELWAALSQGTTLRQILEDFYNRVYTDGRLAPFFQNVTKARSVDKQYLFLRQLFSGEKIYFGDRPRNAHHWMVISDELFDHRLSLMAECLRRAALPEHLVARWLRIEESFRDDIVKATPIPRVVAGLEQPLEGFGEDRLEVGTLCDGCAEEVQAGVTVRYHLRLGTIYCPACSPLNDI